MENFLDELGLCENKERIKGIIEAVVFASGDPVPIKDLSEATGISIKRIKEIIEEMKKDYDKECRGIVLMEFNNKLQYGTKCEYAEYIKKILKPDSKQRLSQAALETLAIVSYKQPVTRAEIDEIRGVRSESAVATLLEKGLIMENGRKEAAGRPILYATTDEFLKYFGFKNIKELPKLIEFNMDFRKE